MLFVIEGQDATGKDTQAEKLVEYFKAQGKNVVHYAESGTASPNDFIRSIAELNYGSQNDIDPRTHAMLYLVNRYEQWKKLAEPALKNNDIVIITRYWLSTYVYEGYGIGVSRPLIVRLHKLIMPEPYFHPDKIVLLTLSDEERAKRLIAQGKRSKEFFKSKDAAFQKKLNDAYVKSAEKFSLKKFWNI